jgi:PKD repeat protein
MLRKFSLSAAIMAVLASTLVLLPAMTGVASAAQPVPGHTKLVPDVPRTNMPRITDGEIFDLAYIGDRVFVVGTFTSIRNNTTTNTTSYAQRYVASFNLTTGLVDASFRPTFDGAVNAIEASPDGTKLYVAGRFNTVSGVTKRKVASINPTTGATVTGFTANANAAGTALEATNTTLYIGGQFTAINNVARVGLTAVNGSTGTNLTNFRNDLSGGIGVNGLLTVQQLVLSPNDGKLLVVHTGRRIAGQDRYGVGIIDTATNTLSPWKTNLWQDNLQFVGGIQRIFAGAISPDGQYFVVSSGSGGDRPPINDTAVAFPLNSTSDNVQPLWISRLFDSVYSIAISETAVYLGGHFNYMESPTARDPWPGLDDVGYGRGQGLAGYGLGDEIVTRDHIGAISPATGKALEWNPGSNSFEGNKAMLVHPRGLITGGDATTQGGYNIGRVAFYDFNSVAAPGANETTITNPIEGRVKKADEQFVIDGTATAASGVRRVQLELIDRTSGRYLQDDLVTWGAANTINVNLASPNATSTSWSLPLTISGNRLLKAQAKTFAVNGSSDATKAIKKFETFGLADETPTTSITGPSGVQTSTTFTVTGTAVDDNGVNSIRFTMRDANGRYIQDDGSADTAYNTFSGQPDVIGATAATWSYEITVPYESEWTMQATAVDTAGQADLRSADRSWIVSSTAIAPSVAVSAPVAMLPPTAAFPLTVAPGGPITFAGSATDDTRLANVEIQLQNTTTREKLASDGTWSTDSILGWYRVLPLNSNVSSYNWTYTTPFNLVPGTYTFTVRATDNEGITTASSNYGRLTVNAQVTGDAAPDTLLNATGTITGLLTRTIDLAGTTTDAQGVASVGVTIRERNLGLYLQPNGTLSSAYALLPTTLATPGGTASVWTKSVTLPQNGSYDVTAIATDTVGQQDLSSTGATARYQVYPGDLAPTINESLLAPTEGTAFTESRILVSGRTEDDQQIASAQVAIRNSLGQYMSSTGAFTSTTESWRTAFLNSPGSPGSNFSYTTPAIPAGAYTVLVRGIDQNDQITPVPSVRNVTVNAPASNLAPTPAFTFSCVANRCTFDGRTSTDENPATLTYAWSWGTTPATTGTGPVPIKTFTSAGTFTVTLTVKDEYGISAVTTRQVTIVEPATNVAPTAVLNPPSCLGLVCNFSAIGSVDSNVGDSIAYLWNFGDGQPTSTASALTKTFLAAGTYTVTLTVTDGWGKATTVTRQVTVSAV